MALAQTPGLQAQTEPDPLALHYQAAQESLRGGDQERASREYKAFLGEAIHRVANAKALIGDLNGAAPLFMEAMDFPGPGSSLPLDYASVLFDQSRWKEAESAAQPVVEVEPGNLRARVLLGRILFEEKNYAGAKIQFESVPSHGKVAEVWQLLSITYLRLQDLASARSLLRRTVAALGDTPQNHVAVAMIYYLGDYPDQAIEELKAVIAKTPGAPEAHYDLGLAYLARNEEAGYPRAIPEFRLQLKSDPDHFPSYYMLGYIALKQRNFAEAERDLNRASALNPGDRGTQLLLGQLYSETNREPSAEEVLRKLIANSDSRSPNYELVRAHYILGRDLQNAGKVEDGISEINESERLRKSMRQGASEIEESRTHSPAKPTIGVDVGGDLAGDSSRSHASQADREQVESFVSHISPAIAEGYFNLAGIARHQRDDATAEQYLQKAIHWDPSLAHQKQ